MFREKYCQIPKWCPNYRRENKGTEMDQGSQKLIKTLNTINLPQKPRMHPTEDSFLNVK